MSKRRRFDMTELAESMGEKGGGAWDVPYGEIAGLTALQSRVLWAVNFDAIEWRVGLLLHGDPLEGSTYTFRLGEENVYETLLQLETMGLVEFDRKSSIVVRGLTCILTDAGRLKL